MQALLAIVLSAASACSSSSSSSDDVTPTMLTVAPSTFGQGVVCGSLQGAWRSYVATLTDVTDPDSPFALPSSGPISCSVPVSFEFVVPGHQYTATVEGYDREDIHPYGGASSGNPHMVADDNTEVAPVWSTTCGSVQEAVTTEALLNVNVLVRGCAPLTALQPAGEASVSVDLAATRDGLSWGNDPGQIHRIRVIPGLAELAPVEVPLSDTPDAGAPDGDPVVFAGVPVGSPLSFAVQAYERDSGAVRWATTCTALPVAGVTIPAQCGTLSNQGALRIDIGALLEAAGDKCEAGATNTYRASLVGSSQLANPRACDVDAVFNHLDPALYQIVVEALSSTGEVRFTALCEASVSPATTALATCDVPSVQ